MTCLNTFAATLCLTITTVGCSNQTSSPSTPHSSHTPGTTSQKAHAHAALGPRGGQLIELGDEEYHAELLHDDDSHIVTVYILDGEARNDVGISAPHLTIHTGDDHGADYTLEPVQLDHEAHSATFCYETSSADLCHALDEAEANAELLVEIDGRTFKGTIEHSPGHEHQHAHEHSHAGRHAQAPAAHIH